MKNKIITTLILALATATLMAQDADVDRATVPFSDPNGAKTVVCDLMHGHITVKAYAGKEVIVEAHGAGIARGRTAPPPGMRRIGPSNAGLTVEESSNEIRVRLGVFVPGGDVTLQVPAETALKLKTLSGGGISVEGTSGEIDADSLNGDITLTGVSGAVVAHTLNGKLVVTISQPPAKPMSFSTLNGVVDVTLPAATKADLRMKSGRGDVFSDFDITLKPNPQATPEVTRGRNNRLYRISFDRAMLGTINGGGPELQFTTFNGAIFIHKK